MKKGSAREAWVAAAAVVAAAIALGAGALPQEGASPGRTVGNGIRGFVSERVAAERELERKMMAVPSPEAAENTLEFLTSAPHLAGTDGSRRVAEYLREQLKSSGWDAEIVRYWAWMPQPVEQKLEMTEPEKMVLGRQEEPIEQDPTTKDARALPGMNGYSPSGQTTAPVVYVNYGLPEDYEKLKEVGVEVGGKIAIARYGNSFRGVKAYVAEEHKCAGLIIYSDPADDGYVQGDPMPKGPWRPMSGIQRGSILYIFKYPGDPLTPGAPAEDSKASLKPQDAASLPRIPTLPISPRDAAELLSRLDGPRVPKGWQGGLPFTYHTGPGRATAHLTIKMDYGERALYDVIGKLRGETDDEWVVAGNHHDAWVFGAVDPSSGTTSLLEAARALGSLAKQGWKPRRTIVFGFWDGEEYGLLGSTEWVEGHVAELQRKAVAYVNLDAVVSGPNFGGGATPSLAEIVRDVAREVKDPNTGKSVFEAWKEQQKKATPRTAITPESTPVAQSEAGPSLGPLGSGSDYTPFFQHAGIPSIDMAFSGEYGVYHSIYDDFFWMKHFGDPKFLYHAAMGRIAGLVTLRLAEADVLPFDYGVYAGAIESAVKELEDSAKAKQAAFDFSAVRAALAGMKSAAEKAKAAQEAGANRGDRARLARLNRGLVETERALLAPDGLAGRPWFRHTIYAPGTYTGYAAVVLPGVREAMDKKDWETARKEMRSVEAALGRAKAKLEEAAVQ